MVEEGKRQQEYIPCQINPRKVIEFCESAGVDPNDYWVLGEVMIRNTAYTSPGLIAAIGKYNREPHHLVVLTTSDVLKQGLAEEDQQLLGTLKSRILSRSLLDHLFGERVKDDKGARRLDRLLEREGMEEAQRKQVLEKLYIHPTRRGDIELIIAQDDFLEDDFLHEIGLQLTTLKSGLRKFGRINLGRCAPQKDFCNGLLRAVRPNRP